MADAWETGQIGFGWYGDHTVGFGWHGVTIAVLRKHWPPASSGIGPREFLIAALQIVLPTLPPGLQRTMVEQRWRFISEGRPTSGPGWIKQTSWEGDLIRDMVLWPEHVTALAAHFNQTPPTYYTIHFDYMHRRAEAAARDAAIPWPDLPQLQHATVTEPAPAPPPAPLPGRAGAADKPRAPHGKGRADTLEWIKKNKALLDRELGTTPRVKDTVPFIAHKLPFAIGDGTIENAYRDYLLSRP